MLSADQIQSAEIPPDAGAVLTIDLGALVENWKMLRDKAPGAECAATVKANAYGIGQDQAVGALHKAGCRTFFVALLSEALRLRRQVPDARIFIFNSQLGNALDTIIANRLSPVLGSVPEIKAWLDVSPQTGDLGAPALHIDTGMNRLGLRADRLEDRSVVDMIERLDLSLIMSHLACSDDPDHPMNERQRTAFDGIRARFPAVPASLANSGGVLLGDAYHYDLVRPGIALYGGYPFHVDKNPMRPVVHLHARILQVMEAEPGETVGYGATRTLTRPTRIATLSAGYADGYLRSASSSDDEEGAHVYVGPYRAPFLGRISMDLISIDVTDIPEALAQPGASAELLGANVTVDEVANEAGTIDYEILTGLGRRYHRIYMPAAGS